MFDSLADRANGTHRDRAFGIGWLPRCVEVRF